MANKILTLATLALIGAGAAVPAFAQDATPAAAPAEKAMKGPKADTDGDGFISKAEFLAAQEKRFSEIDGNADCKIAKEEMKAHYDKMRAMRGDKRGPKPGDLEPRAQEPMSDKTTQERAAPAGDQ